MQQREVKFQYKGSRKYIHGTDMFNEMTAGFPEGTLQSLRFSVHGFVLSSLCDVYESSHQEDLSAIADIRARCQFEYQGKMHYRVLTESPESASIHERYEYDENEVVSKLSLSKEGVHLNESSPFSFIETIVAMNKHHLQSLFPDVVGKWVFTRIDLKQDCHAKDKIHLIFRHNMNFRLIKSDVWVDGEKVGDIYFSLVKS